MAIKLPTKKDIVDLLTEILPTEPPPNQAEPTAPVPDLQAALGPGVDLGQTNLPSKDLPWNYVPPMVRARGGAPRSYPQVTAEDLYKVLGPLERLGGAQATAEEVAQPLLPIKQLLDAIDRVQESGAGLATRAFEQQGAGMNPLTGEPLAPLDMGPITRPGESLREAGTRIYNEEPIPGMTGLFKELTNPLWYAPSPTEVPNLVRAGVRGVQQSPEAIKALFPALERLLASEAGAGRLGGQLGPDVLKAIEGEGKLIAGKSYQLPPEGYQFTVTGGNVFYDKVGLQREVPELTGKTKQYFDKLRAEITAGGKARSADITRAEFLGTASKAPAQEVQATRSITEAAPEAVTEVARPISTNTDVIQATPGRPAPTGYRVTDDGLFYTKIGLPKIEGWTGKTAAYLHSLQEAIKSGADLPMADVTRKQYLDYITTHELPVSGATEAYGPWAKKTANDLWVGKAETPLERTQVPTNAEAITDIGTLPSIKSPRRKAGGTVPPSGKGPGEATPAYQADPTPPTPYTVGGLMTDVMNLPRAALTSADISYPGFQGILLAPGHPNAWRKMWVPMMKSLASEDAAKTIDASIISKPEYRLLKASGLQHVDPMGAVGQKEEAYQISNFVGNIPIIKESSRAFTTAGNVFRWELGPSTLRDWVASGKVPAEMLTASEKDMATFIAKNRDGKDLQILTNFYNAGTGRGNISRNFESILPYANAFFFAPRFFVSRIEIPYYGLQAINRALQGDPALLKVIGKDLGVFSGSTLASLAMISQIPGVHVELDPRSSDFAKIRYKNTRYDFYGGYQPLIRYAAQGIKGQRKTLGTGEIKDINRLSDVLWPFIRSKLSPPVALGVDVNTKEGTNVIGEKVDFSTPEGQQKQLIDRMAPMFVQSMIEGYKMYGAPGLAMGLPSMIGVGSQTFQTAEEIGPQQVVPGLLAYHEAPKDVARLFADGNAAKEASYYYYLQNLFSDDRDIKKKLRQMRVELGDTASQMEKALSQRRLGLRKEHPELESYQVGEKGNTPLSEQKVPTPRPTATSTPQAKYAPTPLAGKKPTVDRVMDDLAEVASTSWSRSNPDGSKLSYEQLTPQERKVLSDFNDRLNTKANEVYGVTYWSDLKANNPAAHRAIWDAVLKENNGFPVHPADTPTPTPTINYHDLINKMRAEGTPTP